MSFGVVVVADNLEFTYFGCVVDVLSYAKALVVVAYFDDSDRLGSVVGQSFEVEAILCFLLSYYFVGDVEVAVDDVVDSLFELCDLRVGGLCRDGVVEFRFFSFDMCGDSPAAVEEVYHRAVDDVFGGVHWGIFLFVVCVELCVFHIVVEKENGHAGGAWPM